MPDDNLPEGPDCVGEDAHAGAKGPQEPGGDKPSPQPGAAPRKIRWWPLIANWVVILVLIGIIRHKNANNAQFAFMFSTFTFAAGLGLSALWAVLISGLPGKLRLLIAAACVCVPALLAGLFEIKGVDGNFHPIIVPRWANSGPVQVAPEIVPSLQVTVPPGEEKIPGLADYPQFFGPNRDGKLAGPRLARDWDAQPPREVWRRQVGEGLSGFAVKGDYAVTQEQHGDEETVVCYVTTTGQVRWVHRDNARYFRKIARLGPRATPTIDGGSVFTLGGTGILNCLNLGTGEVLWSTNMYDANGTSAPEWGGACSPLVVGEKVIVSPGGDNGHSLVAYHRETGDLIWSAGSDKAHYCSPKLATIAGIEQVIILNATTLASHRLEDGEELWTFPWDGSFPNVALPVVLEGDRVLASSGYGVGAYLVQINRAENGRLFANEVWRSLQMKAKFANIIAIGNYVYGLDDGQMACVNLSTGRREWKDGRYGHGQEILVGDVLLIATEQGEVLLQDPTPDESRELTRMRVLDGETWNPPALAGEYLLVRNDREAACFRLPVRGE